MRSGVARIAGWCGAIASAALLAFAPPASAQLFRRTAAPAPAAAAPNPFAKWVAVIAAGDYRAHSGAPAEVFDNARRDLVKAFVGMGFAPDRIAQFSVRPELYPDTKPLPVKPPGGFYKELKRLADQEATGCLIYITSHGSPQGVLYGDVGMSPGILKGLLDRACGERPTIAVISACFSGVFVPVLAAPNRMVMSAARPDRSSFGCSEDEVYTYFDKCVLDSLPTSATFDILAEQARVCVDKREKAMRLKPASEPQVSIGAEIAALLPTLRLDAKPPG